MISIKCNNCAGEMSIDSKGELICPYCGSKSHLSDMEYSEYKNFRLNMLNYLRALADESADASDDSFLWSYHDNISFYSKQGTRLNINYLFYSKIDGVDMYVAKDSVIFIFTKSDKNRADMMVQGVKMIQYPSAALKNLSKYFPTIKAKYELEDDGIMVVVHKPENAYPLYALGSVQPEHAAWIVSRLENICCVLEFSDIIHGGISIDSVFINTRTHEAFLYGGWWNWSDKRGSRDLTDLSALRKVANKVMGDYRNQAPDLFLRFINEAPCIDAYTDFEKWDKVIMDGFGGHKFAKFNN